MTAAQDRSLQAFLGRHAVFMSRQASDQDLPEVEDYEVSAEFVPVAGISERIPLGPVDLAFLRAARAQRRGE